MKKYKALMIDLDGTTIPNQFDGMPSQKVKEAITKAQKYLYVCVVTSTPLWRAQHIIKALNLSSLCVVDGGGQIFNPQLRKVIWEQPLESSDAKKLWQFAKTNNIPFLYSDGLPKRHAVQNKKMPEKLIDMLYRGLTNETADGLITQLSSMPAVSFHKMHSWDTLGTTWLKITHVKSTKQHGIIFVSKQLGIHPHEIIGVGDGYNDFPLLIASGLKVAMGNAVSELKEIADYIAPSVEKDGLVDVIEKFVLQ